MRSKHVVIVGYDEITSLDLSGPLEAFSSAVIENASGNLQRCYQVTIAALGAKNFSSESGLHITANCLLSSIRQVDTLLIPGGRGMRSPSTAAKLARWLSPRANRIRRSRVDLYRRLRTSANGTPERETGDYPLEIRG